MEDVCKWLRNYLKDGPKNVNDVREAARSAGYTRREFREAKRLCCIKTDHPNADEWIWSLPED